MSAKNHYRKKDIDTMLKAMNEQWDALVATLIDKGRKLVRPVVKLPTIILWRMPRAK